MIVAYRSKRPYIYDVLIDLWSYSDIVFFSIWFCMQPHHKNNHWLQNKMTWVKSPNYCGHKTYLEKMMRSSTLRALFRLCCPCMLVLGIQSLLVWLASNPASPRAFCETDFLSVSCSIWSLEASVIYSQMNGVTAPRCSYNVSFFLSQIKHLLSVLIIFIKMYFHSYYNNFTGT